MSWVVEDGASFRIPTILALKNACEGIVLTDESSVSKCFFAFDEFLATYSFDSSAEKTGIFPARFRWLCDRKLAELLMSMLARMSPTGANYLPLMTRIFQCIYVVATIALTMVQVLFSQIDSTDSPLPLTGLLAY